MGPSEQELEKPLLVVSFKICRQQQPLALELKAVLVLVGKGPKGSGSSLAVPCWRTAALLMESLLPVNLGAILSWTENRWLAAGCVLITVSHPFCLHKLRQNVGAG